FIICGDHDLTENIVHPVLARIEGAPAGTKGISLFLVPKIWVNEDGSLGETNDVVCTGVEEKMGIHGSPTCQMAFGAKGQCKGVLLGEENKGMKVMFHMMNEARLGIGAVGLGNASCAYLSALNYARERVQGRDIEQMFNKDAESVSIIRHPDVRRMLMWMKSHVEGMRSFVYYTANLFDKEETAATPEDKAYYSQLIDLLTPVIKSYCTDRGFDVTVQAMQVYGGYGYTNDYPVERLMRDSKINSIYEGTNGIQAMDLLGRKMGMEKGQVFMNFINEIKQVIARAKETEGLVDAANQLDTTVDRLAEVAMHIGMQAMSPDFKTAFSFASPFLEAMGDVIMGWMLLWRATVAAPALEKLVKGLDDDARLAKINKNKNAAFYEGQ
ncbi:MAG: acyl-CoA dehydrogenase, partial [Desulfobacterales bacterium]|nr:acyl-CoA dehydrogenase [Desulfobacterales bacterium]